MNVVCLQAKAAERNAKKMLNVQNARQSQCTWFVNGSVAKEVTAMSAAMLLCVTLQVLVVGQLRRLIYTNPYSCDYAIVVLGFQHAYGTMSAIEELQG